MKKLITTLKYSFIALCMIMSVKAFAQDFKVQHIQDDIGNAGGTNTSFVPVSSLNSAFLIPGNNKMTHAGRSDSDNNALEGDDMSGARVLTATNTVTYYREAGSNANGMNFQSMLWEYTGGVGGANEFIVRGRYIATLYGDSTMGEGKTLATIDISSDGVVNANKCIPFITGILNNDSGNGADSGTAIAYLDDANTLTVKRGTWDNNVVVYVTLVEFTGSNWSVLHGTSGGSNDDTGTITLKDGSDGTGTDTGVNDWNNAIIFTQSKAITNVNSGGAKQNISSQWPLMKRGLNNETVDWTYNSGRDETDADNKNNHFVHVLENSRIEVSIFSDTSSADNESTIDISTANLLTENEALIMGTSITSGNANGYGRGWRNYYFNSSTEAAHWCHRDGSTMEHYIQVVNLNPVKHPGGVSAGLGLWLKADRGVEEAAADTAEDGDAVLNWLDNTANGNDAIQSAVSNRPIYNDAIINFNPALDFDGNHEMIANVATSADVTIFAVTEGTFSSTKTLLNLDNGANGSIDVEQVDATTMQGSYTDSALLTSGIASATITSGTPYLVNYRQQTTGGSNRIFINGSQTLGGTPNANTLSGTFNVGVGADPSTNSTRWDGKIAEIIVYNYKVPLIERLRIESYLGIKYGITLGVNGTSQDYVDSDDLVIWDVDTGVAAEDVFNYNVTGVGRDDASGLEQKQSKTINTNDDITIGIKGIEASNKENLTPFFADKTFLFWGNDAGSTSSTRTITGDFGTGSLSATAINRSWKMVVTDSVPTVDLTIPKAMVSNAYTAGEDYIMIIADDESFSVNVTSATMEDLGTELKVDWYFEGTKYVTFGSAPTTNLGSRSAYFDNYGTTDTYFDAGDVNDLDNTNFTISAWVRRDVGAEKFDIVSKRNYYGEFIHPTDSLQDKEGSYSHGYAFRINKSGQFRMVWRDENDVNNNQLQTNETIPWNEWHHIAASYDIGANKAILYIDGIHVYDSDDYFVDKGYSIDPLNTPSDAHFMIGAAHHIKRQQKVRGSIDEVRVWNVVLSPEQIRYVMNQELRENGSFADGVVLPSSTLKNEILPIPWNNLIAYYPMSNAVFGSIRDESNSGNDASMISYNNLEVQTSPLPYKSKQDGAWDDENTWENGDVQYLPGVVSYLRENFDTDDDGDIDDDDRRTIDYNIVQINDVVTLDNSNSSLIPLFKNGNRTVLGLAVNLGADLELIGDTAAGEGNGITISHYLKLDGTIDLEGESQLIQTDRSFLDPSSEGTLERDQQGTKDLYTYNYWSSPVGLTNDSSNNNDYKVTDVFDNVTFSSSGYDGVDGATPQLADYWIWKYANNITDTYSEWQHVRSTNDIKTGEGFTMKGVANTATSFNEFQNYIYKGKPNNGDSNNVSGNFELEITAGNDYLIGNPYPSALDADLFILDNLKGSEESEATNSQNVINGVLYYWDHFANKSHYLADYEGGYAVYTLVGGTIAISNDDRIDASWQVGTKTPQKYIPVGQGFFVSAVLDLDLIGDTYDPVINESVDGGDIVFKNSQRVFMKESVDDSFFMKTGKAKNNTVNRNIDTRSKFKLKYSSPNGYYRQLLVGVDENATNKYDLGFDAPLNEDNKEDMYWMLNKGKLVIQAVNNFNEEQSLPIGIKTSIDGVSKIAIDELINIDDSVNIYLYDGAIDTYYDLRENDFELFMARGEYKDRFEIRFAKQDKEEDEEEIVNKEVQVIYSTESGSVIVINPSEKNIESIEFYNLLGQRAQFFKLDSSEKHLEIKAKGMKTGVYILGLKTENGYSSKKIIVNN